MQIKFEKGVEYRTANGTAWFNGDHGISLSFAHWGKENYPHLSHDYYGKCTGVDSQWRKFDIIVPSNEIVVFFVPDGEGRGWTVRQGERTADGLGIDEMLGLFVALTFKSPLPCLQWLKTDEQREADQKHHEERVAENARKHEEEAAYNAMIKAKADALDKIAEMASFRGTYFGDPMEYVTWVKSHLVSEANFSNAHLKVLIAQASKDLGFLDSEKTAFSDQLKMIICAAKDAKKDLDTIKKIAAGEIPF